MTDHAPDTHQSVPATGPLALKSNLVLGPNAHDVARESVDDALMIVESYGPWGADLNDAHRRQIVLADEVLRLRGLYEMAVRGRAEMRSALRQERRAEELHEGCQMPMEQARELAASESSPDWYARGQDWALADAMSGSLPNDWTAGDIARAYAAGARSGEGVLAAEVTRLVDKCNSYIVDNARLAEQVESLRAEVAQARETAEYWKAEHLAGNARIGELHDELAATDLRSADHLRKAIKAEAEVALLRAALNGGNVIERLQFALQRLADATEALGVNNFGEDWRSDEVQELQAATHAARLVLGPNV